MTKEFWLNLPVKNVQKSKEFFTKLGFEFNPEFGNGDNCACLMAGEKKLAIMLFDEPTFQGFISNKISDTKLGTEILLSFDAQSPQEVDEMAKKVLNAGGKTAHQPAEMKGWMYGFVFADLDGHQWNILYMDRSKMPKA